MTNRPTKVIVIEDSQSLNDLLSQSIYSQLGIKVDSAKSLDEAIDLIILNKDSYIAALVDLNLPDAPNGEIVDAVISFGVRPIILTATISDDIHDEMLDKPIIDYVIKRNINEIQYVIDMVKRLNENFDRKVLVVDDSKTSRALIKSLLERHYFNVDTASTGPEALDLLNKNQDYALVITDFNMPKMNGAELVAKIRNNYSRNELAIIGISSVGSGSVSVQLLKSGANDFISRPFLHEEFYCRINQNIDNISYYNALKTLNKVTHKNDK